MEGYTTIETIDKEDPFGIKPLLDEAYNQAIDHCIGIVGEYNDTYTESKSPEFILLQAIITSLSSLKKETT